MENFISFLYNTIQSPYFLFLILCFSMAIKIRYIVQFTIALWQKHVVIKPLLFLLVSITSALICDITWLIKLVQALFLPIPYYVVVFFIRFAWAFLIVQYQSLSLFLQALTHPNFEMKRWHIATTLMTVLFSCYFLYLAFFQPFTLATVAERDIARLHMTDPEFIVMRYIIPILVYTYPIAGLLFGLRNMRRFQLPKLLRTQVKLFSIFFVLPYLIIEFILATCFTLINDMYFMISISTLLLALAVYYCLHNVLKIRLLNTIPRVHGTPKSHVIDEFKTVLRELSNATNSQELTHITQLFFKEAFAIPLQAIHLSIREQYPKEDKQNRSIHDDIVEAFMAKKSEKETPLFILDEIAFNNFYDPKNSQNAHIAFLKKLNADIFLPIFSKSALVGYITIDAGARKEHISHSEQDAMIAFATYLGNVINLLRHRNVHTLLYKEKKLKDSLYTKHQEINYYKESVHAFLRQSKQKLLGIIFFKNGHFKRANDDAKKIIPFDPNIQEGHPLSKALQEVARYVDTFNTPYSIHTKDNSGNPLLLSGVPHLKQQHVIITISYPDISDVILQQMHLLHDPNDWDYLLYLSSTKAGTQINDAIPSDEEIALNGKIKLLKSALNKKAILLNAPEQDQQKLVQLIHSISLRENLHTLALSSPTSFEAIAPTLFGSSHPAFQEVPLLQKLKNGTLFIKGVHYLDTKAQSLLAELIACGWYRLSDSDKTIPSTTRIICSSSQYLSDLVHAGRFDAELYGLLKKETVTIPSVSSLSRQEVHSLIDGFSDRMISSDAIKHICSLTEKEKNTIIDRQPVSLHELEAYAKEALQEKAFTLSTNPTSSLTSKDFDDPELVLASRLGKQALKHEHIMTMLWNKFKNQNKIALFLGVNRSSVNRRFKAFHIGQNSEGIA